MPWTGPGLLRDACAVLAEHDLSIISSHTTTDADRVARISFEFELADVSQLDSLLSSALSLESVFDAYRVMPGRRRDRAATPSSRPNSAYTDTAADKKSELVVDG